MLTNNNPTVYNKNRNLLQLQSLKAKELIRIGELATISGVRMSTLKHYTEINLLKFNQEGSGLIRRYVKGESLKRLKKIKRLKKKLTINEIKKILWSKK